MIKRPAGALIPPSRLGCHPPVTLFVVCLAHKCIVTVGCEPAGRLTPWPPISKNPRLRIHFVARLRHVSPAVLRIAKIEAVTGLEVVGDRL